MRIRCLVAVGAVSVVALAACGSDSDESGTADTRAPAAVVTTEATATPATEPPAAADPYDIPAGTEAAAPSDGGLLQLLDTSLGNVMGDSEGFTVYLFTPDGQGDSTCYDECASNWPFVAEASEVGEGLDASLLGTTERTTGETQATYNGWPLYSYAGDATPGDTTGQGVGGVWFALDASGAAIES